MKKYVFGLLTLLLIGGLAAYRINDRLTKDAVAKTKAEKITPPAVTAGVAGRRTMQPRIQITGNIRPKHEVDIFSKAAGRIVAVKAVLGQKVRAGEPLALVEQDIYVLQLKQANGALAAARANLMNVQKNAESAETLARSNNIADVSLVGARAGLAAARAGVMQAEAAVGLAGENLKNTRITSPIDGVITRKAVDIGQMVSPQAMGPMAALFQVQDLSSLKLEASIDEKEIQYVKAGQPVRFAVDAFPGETFTGTVSRLSPSLDPVSRRASIEIALANPEGRLYANMFARGEIIQEEAAREVLALPGTALVKEADKTAVYVLTGSTVKRREVTVGEGDGDYVAIREGLKEGEQVVLSGQSRLSDGIEVIVQPSQTQVRN